MAIVFHKIGLWLKDRPSRQWQMPVVAAVVICCIVMTIFQLAKNIVFPGLSLWKSQALSVVFTSVLAGVVTYVGARLYAQILRYTAEEASERIRVSEELRDEKIFMRALMEHTPDHIYFKDLEGRFLRVNQATASSLGLVRPAEAIGKTDFDFFTPEHAWQAMTDEKQILASGDSIVGKEERETWPDNHESWVSTTKLPLRDRRGQIIGTFGISRDITDHLKRELHFRQLYRAVEASPTMVMITNAEGDIEYVNPRFAAITGYAAEEVMGKNPRLLKSDMTPPELYVDLWKTIKAGDNWSGEILNRRKNGEFHWARMTISPMRNSVEAITHFVAVAEDVTEEKRAADALQLELEKRVELERIINRSPAVVFLWSAEPGWPVQYVSENVSQFGYTSKFFTSGLVPFANVIHPDDLERVTREVDEVVAKGDAEFTQVYRMRAGDGTFRWLEDRSFLRRDGAGNVTHFQGIVLDVTERKNAEEDARKMTEGLRNVLDVADELIGCADIDAVYRRAVELAREKLGLERCGICVEKEGDVYNTYGTNLRGETTDERVYHIPINEKWRERLALRQRHEQRWSQAMGALFEFDGVRMRPLERMGVVVTTPIQTAKRAVGVFFNDYAITGTQPDRTTQEVIAVYCSLLANIISRKQAELENERIEASQRLVMERTNRLNSLGLLAAGMAHEINNPLQGMLSHLHLARRKLPLDFAAHDSLDMVGKGIETIAALVRKLLALGSTSERGTEYAECGDVITFVANLLESQLVASKVNIKVENTSPTAKVRMSRRELIQVIMNLVINARDAMPDGGEVTIRAFADSKAATISVSDAGKGIAPELLPQLFMPFFTTKGAKGSGLGLSVVEALVRGSGGTVDVQSKLGEGSTFSLRLPLAGSRGHA